MLVPHTANSCENGVRKIRDGWEKKLVKNIVAATAAIDVGAGPRSLSNDKNIAELTTSGQILPHFFCKCNLFSTRCVGERACVCLYAHKINQSQL